MAGCVPKLAGDIVEAISTPFNIDDCEVEIGASVGIAVAPQDGTGTDELLRNADTALYAAKNERGSYCFFARQMAEHARLRQELKADLADALDRDQHHLVYQPIYNVQTGQLVRFEALLRWDHPQRGSVAPAEFIPLAEETGLIGALGDWVLRAACSEAALWPSDVGIAINLSPAQFRPSLPFRVADTLNKVGLRPDRLLLEITETVLLHSTAENSAVLGAAARTGRKDRSR